MQATIMVEYFKWIKLHTARNKTE